MSTPTSTSTSATTSGSSTTFARCEELSPALLEYLLKCGLSLKDIEELQEQNIKRVAPRLNRRSTTSDFQENDPETARDYGADLQQCQSQHARPEKLKMQVTIEVQGQSVRQQGERARPRSVSPPPWPWAFADQWSASHPQRPVVHAE